MPKAIGFHDSNRENAQRVQAWLAALSDLQLQVASTFLETDEREYWITRQPFGVSRTDGAQLDHIAVTNRLMHRSTVCKERWLQSDHFAVCSHVPRGNFYISAIAPKQPLRGWQPQLELIPLRFQELLVHCLDTLNGLLI